ncbi:MAG: 50S ribosomal protein L23 [Leptospirales bacterium]|nr:50S ribosomal protein L23 [Leptospirales bacterium]
MDLHQVIIAPLITEKAEGQKEPRKDVHRYVFRVHPSANKELIRQALHHLFKVKAVRINTMVVPGKKKRFRADRIKLPKWKKAIVTLAPGQSIELVKGA